MKKRLFSSVVSVLLTVAILISFVGCSFPSWKKKKTSNNTEAIQTTTGTDTVEQDEAIYPTIPKSVIKFTSAPVGNGTHPQSVTITIDQLSSYGVA
ncbi:MAG: hypothetical protein IKN50_04970, partial [Clostridia bacterium]|nr:hypothetical protein [Clostridia bacterium]